MKGFTHVSANACLISQVFTEIVFFFRERTERIKQKLLVNKTKELPKSKNESDKEEEFEEYEFGKERKEALKRKA